MTEVKLSHIAESSKYCQAQKGTMVQYNECSICGGRKNLRESAARDLFPPNARHVAPLVIHCDEEECMKLAQDHLLWHRLQHNAYTLGETHPLMQELKNNICVSRSSGAIDKDWFIESSRLLSLRSGELAISMESKGSNVGKSVPLLALVENNKDLFKSIFKKHLQDLDTYWALPLLPDIVKNSNDVAAIEVHAKISSDFDKFVQAVMLL